MGCLMVAVSAVLALVVPASIARTSLAGAYVVIVVLVAAAVAAVVFRARRPADRGGSSRPAALAGIGGLGVVYAVVVTVIHLFR